MKVIDFKKKGNLVRFLLGSDDCNDYWGDDWDDAPYEHNAGPVYDEYAEGHIDLVFPFDYNVREPKDDWRNRGNSGYSKEDMKNRLVPCIVAAKEFDDSNDNQFGDLLGWQDSFKIYFDDNLNKIVEIRALIKEL